MATVALTGNSLVYLYYYEMEKIELQSASSSVLWELIKYPDVINGISDPVFETTNTKASTNLVEYITLNPSGTYVIQATEANNAPVFIYIEAKNILSNVALPFAGERRELDAVNGWSTKLNKEIKNLLKWSSGGTVKKLVVAADTFNVGDMICATDVEVDVDYLIYNGVTPVGAQAGLTAGVIISIPSIVNDDLLPTGYALYEVLEYGTEKIDFEPAAGAALTLNKVYYDGFYVLKNAGTYLGRFYEIGTTGKGYFTIDTKVTTP